LRRARTTRGIIGELFQFFALVRAILTTKNRLITLSNGLKALLVSDPKTDKAAASLSVGIGHLSDPVSGIFLTSLRYPMRC
jgi:secreted Zn-dependent insulinase-like peptidase